MDMAASWTISGVLTGPRELTSEKNKSWRGYVVSIATIGITAEVSVSEAIYKAAAEGTEVLATGRFEMRGHDTKLVASRIDPARAVKP